jgi:SAM-dependent methyltransferase
VNRSADRPYPPLELADRVCSLEGRGDPWKAYEALGAETKSELLALLPDDWTFEGKRVLDFGCGAGRTLRQFLTEAETGELWGADIDGASIEWLQGALDPPLHALRCELAPPLGLERSSFDLIWALSVFTHLTDNSIPWLLELHRLLKPGALLIATYMGRWNSEAIAHEPWDEDRVGMNVLRHNQSWDHGGPMVLMSDWWVRAHWGRAFEILEVDPRIHNQSWALLRRRDVELTVADLERPEDDPREVVALRHNVHQLQREIERRDYDASLGGAAARAFGVAKRWGRAFRSRRAR